MGDKLALNDQENKLPYSAKISYNNEGKMNTFTN